MIHFTAVADALADADWSNVSIGNKAIILAAIDRLYTASREMTAWQSIETAPKNKIDVLVCREGSQCAVIAAWFDQWEYDRFHPEAKTEGGWVVPGGRVIYPPPTLWQPIPIPPPKQTEHEG